MIHRHRPLPLPTAALVLLALSFALPARAQPDPATVAERYFAAYGRADLEELSTFYTADSVMEDPTAVAVGRTARFEGDGIVEFLAASFDAIEGFDLEIADTFDTGPYVVSHGTVSYTVPAATTGSEAATVAARFTAVLEIRDGKVVRHTDYVDYATVLAALSPSPSADGR